MSNIVTEQSSKPCSITLRNVGGQLTADQMEQVAKKLATEWPEYEVTVDHYAGQVAERAARESMWENFPNAAAALAMGNVQGALESFLEDLEQARAERA